MPTSQSSSQEVNILIVIDTDYILQHNSSLSQDPNNPTGIDHNSQYMICTGARKINSGQGTADLNFSANVGDEVSFAATSIYDNSEDAVIVYGIKHWNGANVFNQFVPDLVTRNKAVMPDPNTQNGLPAIQTQLNFSSYDSKVKSSGTEGFYVYIAVYTLSDDGESQNLKGYCYWDPYITVS
jgi:nematocidal protein AidA